MALTPDDFLPTPANYASPEQLAAVREYAKYLVQGAGQQPVKHWTQGVSNVLGAIMGGKMAHDADLQEQSRANEAARLLTNDPVTSSYGPPMGALSPNKNNGTPIAAPATEGAMAPYDFKSLQKANDRLESKGNYSAIGPATRDGDQAYGRYQVMGKNIGPWTEKYVGRRMTPEEFVANPAAQDAVYKGEFGGYLQKYGNPKDAASMWFTGKPLAQGAARSDGHLTGQQYADEYARVLGKGGVAPMAYNATGAVSDAPPPGAGTAGAVSVGPSGGSPTPPPAAANPEVTQMAQALQNGGGAAVSQPSAQPQGLQAAPLQFDPQKEINRVAAGYIRLGYPADKALQIATESVEAKTKYLPQTSFTEYGQLLTQRPGAIPTIAGDTQPNHPGKISQLPDMPGGFLTQRMENGRLVTRMFFNGQQLDGPPPLGSPGGGAPMAPKAPAGAYQPPTGPAAIGAPPAPTVAPTQPAVPPNAATTPPATPATAPAVPPAASEPAKTNDPDWMPYIKGAASPTQAWSAANAPPIPRTAEEALNYKNAKEIAKTTAEARVKNSLETSEKYYAGMRDSNKLVNNLDSQLKLAQKVVEDPKTIQGFGAPVLNDLYKAGLQIQQRIGIPLGLPADSKNLLDWGVPARQELLTKILAGGTLESLRSFLPAGSGQIRVSEINLVEKALGSANLSPQGNKAVIDLVLKINDRTRQMFNAATEYRLTHNGILDEGFDQAWSKYENDRPILTPKEIDEYYKKLDEPAAGQVPPSNSPLKDVSDEELKKRLNIP